MPQQFLERPVRIRPERRHRHDAGQAKAAGCLQLFGQQRNVSGRRPAAVRPGVVVQAHLDEAVQAAPAGQFLLARPSPAPAPSRAGTVHGVHGVGIPDHGLGFLLWSWPTKCHREVQVLEHRRLCRRLLVAVLAEIRYAKPGQPADVLGGVELADHYQPRRVVGAACRRRAAAIRCLTASRRSASCSVRASPAAGVCQSWVHTSPANLPGPGVPAVGEQGRRFQGCRAPGIRWARPGIRAGWRRRRAGRAPASPRRWLTMRTAATAATSSRSSAGTS